MDEKVISLHEWKRAEDARLHGNWFTKAAAWFGLSLLASYAGLLVYWVFKSLS